ncbi:MAG: acetoin utilization protein AcuC [Deinococcales bacterium]
MSRTIFLHNPKTLSYDLGQHHPFKAIRPEAVKHLLESFGVRLHVQDFAPAELEDILSTHARGYVARVQKASAGEDVPDAFDYGIGTSDTPIFAQMHEATAAVCGGTLEAARLITTGAATRVLGLAGGLHHAQYNMGGGFCVYNDLSIAIRYLTAHGLRVAYLDVDAHHGDGVQWLHYHENNVLTISLHQTGRYLYPGTGYIYELGREAGLGYSLNVPLEPYTQDRSYLEALERVLLPALRWFKPDVLVLQGGADSHQLDPLADLCLTTQGYAAAYRLIVQLAEDVCGGKILATGGGGYATLHAVPRVWAELYAALEQIRLPRVIPSVWLEHWQPQSTEILPLEMSDVPYTIPRQAQIEAQNAKTVTELLEAWRRVI